MVGASLLGRRRDKSPNVAASSNEPVSPEDIDEVEGEGQSILKGIIQQLTSGSDLSRITLPTFILERKSMLERISNSLQHADLLLKAHEQQTAEARFLEVVRFYMAGWHITPKAVKKPLNPALGEYFTCYWDYPDGSQGYYLAEQTSHHPPKSSYFYMCPEHHIRVDGILLPRPKFLGNSVASMMEGIGYLKFLDTKDNKGEVETYELTQPNIFARGILIGSLKYEMGDHSLVSCKNNDLICDIEFKTKGFISGTYHAIYGEIKNISTGKVLYEITGKWNEVMEIRDTRTDKKSVLFDSKTKATPPSVRPISEQGPMESRRLWEKTIIALGQRNHQEATAEKFKIEDGQRKEARKRAEEGIDFHPKLFKPVNSPLQYELYLDIDGKTPEEQRAQIFSLAPFLPGQKFHEEFEIPAFKKSSQTPTNASSAALQSGNSPSEGALNMTQVKQALPSSDDDDDFHDAKSN